MRHLNNTKQTKQAHRSDITYTDFPEEYHAANCSDKSWTSGDNWESDWLAESGISYKPSRLRCSPKNTAN